MNIELLVNRISALTLVSSLFLAGQWDRQAEAPSTTPEHSGNAEEGYHFSATLRRQGDEAGRGAIPDRLHQLPSNRDR